MQDMFIIRGRSRRRNEDMTNLHYYRVEIFYSVIDMQLQELNNRFDKVNTSLLLCMACLDPKDSFSAFDMDKLIELAKFYPSDGIGDLAKRMVATRKHHVFPLVYLLVKLSLLLSVATATVERIDISYLLFDGQDLALLEERLLASRIFLLQANKKK
ncbi:hypothetical protein K2173_024827 [Erythroxylum novogranatense]|uniref:Uncharacterized protein n=1 Tax=Erythroxylum novogranatense TaxID=1862640 RepID=A0AAV8UG24_9ROSI|nr:hypothetical protein K2173_024827 [Erythroxylum novogranatense]